MNKQDFAEQIRGRQDEIKELEELVESYAKKIKGVQVLLRGHMITAFRQGVINTLEHLDHKAIEARMQRQMRNDFIEG